MALTQKYKQQQQQVRVTTNESNYLKGMYFTDAPLSEGYSKLLVNYDINSMSGALAPRKGLHSISIVKPDESARFYLNNRTGYNIVTHSKVCAESDTVDPRKVNRHLQSILYNTELRSLLVATCAPDISENNKFKVAPFSKSSAEEYISPEPFVIAKPGIHGKDCIHNNFFKKPVGTFAFGGSFYTFLRHNKFPITKLKDLPDATIVDSTGAKIEDYNTLQATERYATGEPGTYYYFTSGISIGIIAYYDADRNLQRWDRSEEELRNEVFQDKEETNSLCYTRLGADIKKDTEIELLDKSVAKQDLIDDQYYVCVINPDQLNPTEASSWGYNMLLEDPYNFKCEDTATNIITILGMLPYDENDKVILTPKKNQRITLKGYYRAPYKYHSDAQNARFYATTKKKIEVATEYETYYTSIDLAGNVTYEDKDGHTVYYDYVTSSSVKQYFYRDANNNPKIVSAENLKVIKATRTENRDPKNETELSTYLTTSVLQTLSFGDWYYLTDTKEYYMIVPGTSLTTKTYKLFGTTQPAASEKLAGLATDVENKIRVHWQLRSSGAATWTDIYNEVFTLSEYYLRQGDHAPFTVTLNMPEDEVLVKLTITDVEDIVQNGSNVNPEEYVLSTNTIGLSLMSDELANTLNLTAKNFDLGKCTGMCEWEQRLVLWGVPEALNTLFVSDVGNPTFFPYPNNVDIFPDPIIAVHNYGNELLVLTTSALYRLMWDTEGTGWTHRLVQQNLHVAEVDTYMSCVVKNMFFFKSGEYYYMMVPKASASNIRGEVAIAPISKPIEKLLDNFHEEVYNLIKAMVNEYSLNDFTSQLVNYFSYVDNTKVVVNYVYDLNWTTGNTESSTNSEYLYVQLIYDTEARTWNMRVFEAPHMLYASHADAIQQDRFIDLTPSLNVDELVLQYYKFEGLSDDAIRYIATVEDVTINTYLVAQIKNYQYLDTGNREINTELKKRLREFQFKIKNKGATNLGFFTSFMIDGSIRKDLQHYHPRLLADPNTNENVLVVERVLDTKTMTYNTTKVERVIVPERMLQDNGELTPTTLARKSDPNRWILDQSAFPGRTLWKIRMPISGKGYTPRVILLSTNEAEYEIFGHSWVYRTMHGR